MKTPTARTAGRAPLPRGAKAPVPGLPLALVRAVFLAALSLSVLRGPLAAIAVPVGPSAISRLASALVAAPPSPSELAGVLARVATRDDVQAWLRLSSMLGLLACGAELLAGMAGMAVQQRTARSRAPKGIYLRVVLPRPQSAASGSAPGEAGGELFRILAGGMSTRGRLLGRAPWCAFVLGAAPDEPVQLGLFVAGDTARRAQTIALVSGAIQGSCAGAVVEPADDPLGAAAAQGYLLTREFALALPAEYPLRMLGPAGCDTLGPLLAAVQPRGARYVEMQIVVRPFGGVSGWALNRGLLGWALALKLLLEQKANYALAADLEALEARLAGAPFEVTLRAVAVAENRRQAAAALDTLAAALTAYQARTASRLQRLVPVRAGTDREASIGRLPKFAPPPAGLLPLRPWRAPDILTAGELACLWHLPTASHAALVRWLDCRRIEAPPQALAGRGGAAGEQVTLGYARRSDGTRAPVGVTLRDLRQILHLTAGMGAGKTRLLANLCRQFVPHGFILIDGKGDDRGGSLCATVRQLIPLADEARLVLLDVLDSEWPVGLNPLAGVDLGAPGGADLALGQVLAVFARLDPDTWAKAPGMNQFATMATLLVLEGEPQPTLAHVKRALLDERYRAQLLVHCRNVEVSTFWHVTYPQLGDGQRSSRDALLRRIDALLTSEVVRYLVTQAQPTLDLGQAIEQGLIVLVPAADMTLGGLSGAVAMLVFQSFVRAAFGREGSDATRPSYPLVVDELQTLAAGAAQDLEVAMTRLRSLGIPALYAHQALSQLGELADLMLINTHHHRSG